MACVCQTLSCLSTLPNRSSADDTALSDTTTSPVAGLLRSSSANSIPRVPKRSLATTEPGLPEDPRSPSSSQRPSRRRKHTVHSDALDLSLQSPFSPRSFSSTLPNVSSYQSSSGANVLFAAGPVGEPVMFTPHTDASPLEGRSDPRHPPHLSEVATEAFSEITRSPGVHDIPRPEHPPPSNFSQSGIVHLLPVEDVACGTQQSSSGNSSGRRFSPSLHSRSGQRSSEGGSLDDPESAGLSPDDSRYSSKLPSSYSGSRSDSWGSGASGPHMTLRYQHVEDEDGHHIVVGREGKLTRCEDEVRATCFRPGS